MSKTILGIFTNRDDAEDTIDKLRSEGFNPKDISLVMRDQGEQEKIATDTGTNAAEGAVSGIATGGVIGGLAGFLAGTAMPALAGLFIAGPIGAALGLTGAAATTISGATTGALAGGLIGALVNMGVPKETATRYQERINEGAILIAVPAIDREEAMIINEIFNEFNASDIQAVTQTRSDLRERQSPSHFQMGAKGGRSRKAGRLEE